MIPRKGNVMMLQNFRNAAVAFGLATYLMLIWVSPSVAGMMDSSPSGALDAVSDRQSTRLNPSPDSTTRMPSPA